MGTIQSSINAGLGTAAGALAAGKHIKQQQLNIDAANAADQEIVETTQRAIEADQFEAQQAILAHAKDEGLSAEEIDRLKTDPTYAQHLRETVMKESRKQGLSLAGKEYDETIAEYGSDSGLGKAAGENLNRAYERLRELNQRIEATNKLKFDLEAAQARLKARGVK